MSLENNYGRPEAPYWSEIKKEIWCLVREMSWGSRLWDIASRSLLSFLFGGTLRVTSILDNTSFWVVVFLGTIALLIIKALYRASSRLNERSNGKISDLERQLKVALDRADELDKDLKSSREEPKKIKKKPQYKKEKLVAAAVTKKKF